MGLRLRDLGTERFTWSDLRAIVKHSPQSSALARARDPEQAQWTVDTYLLAALLDTQNWVAWTKTKDAERKRNKPKPVPRPGDKERKQGRFRGVQTLPLDEMKKRIPMRMD